jgi:hypothetical protein
MATIDEMHNVINNMVENDDKWLLRLIMEIPRHFWYSRVADVMVRALFQAEDNGECYNSVYTVKDDSDTYEIAGCTYWKVGDYEITHITDDLNFSARMLTEDMMNDLIIEKV